MNYYELLPYAFKRFCVTTSVRTGLPTIGSYIAPPVLPASEKPALCTMNILPPMMTVWHHFAKRNIGDTADIIIFDCSGKLKKDDFPGATVLPFLNFYAATKGDFFIRYIARNRKIAWITDDDVFITGQGGAARVSEELSKLNTALFSFKARNWWQFDIDRKKISPAGTYSVALNRDIFYEKEGLSLKTEPNNPAIASWGKPVGRYDTLDFANLQLLKKGYTCEVLPEDELEEYITVFHGVSNGVMLLEYFKTASQMLDYLESPEKKAWNGNILFRVFSALLTIDVIQELHKEITGTAYSLPSLPSRADLQRIRKEVEPHLREEHSFSEIDKAANTLREKL